MMEMTGKEYERQKFGSGPVHISIPLDELTDQLQVVRLQRHEVEEKIRALGEEIIRLRHAAIIRMSDWMEANRESVGYGWMICEHPDGRVEFRRERDGALTNPTAEACGVSVPRCLGFDVFANGLAGNHACGRTEV